MPQSAMPTNKDWAALPNLLNSCRKRPVSETSGCHSAMDPDNPIQRSNFGKWLRRNRTSRLRNEVSRETVVTSDEELDPDVAIPSTETLNIQPRKEGVIQPPPKFRLVIHPPQEPNLYPTTQAQREALVEDIDKLCDEFSGLQRTLCALRNNIVNDYPMTRDVLEDSVLRNALCQQGVLKESFKKCIVLAQEHDLVTLRAMCSRLYKENEALQAAKIPNKLVEEALVDMLEYLQQRVGQTDELLNKLTQTVTQAVTESTDLTERQSHALGQIFDGIYRNYSITGQVEHIMIDELKKDNMRLFNANLELCKTNEVLEFTNKDLISRICPLVERKKLLETESERMELYILDLQDRLDRALTDTEHIGNMNLTLHKENCYLADRMGEMAKAFENLKEQSYRRFEWPSVESVSPTVKTLEADCSKSLMDTVSPMDKNLEARRLRHEIQKLEQEKETLTKDKEALEETRDMRVCR